MLGKKSFIYDEGTGCHYRGVEGKAATNLLGLKIPEACLAEFHITGGTSACLG